jgi:predicted 3-demethylubiquinone-9 3-methyltransferase (glyoxalase superfamily)
MRKITTFLMFNDRAEEAVNFYTSIFKNSSITGTTPGPDGTVMSATFQIDGQEFYAFNGGPHFSFSEGISLFVSCEGQAEVDDLWDKFTADGGEESQCGWLKDKFGVSWQIIPSVLGELLGDKDPEKANRVMQAMLKMNKIIIADLHSAA